MPENKLFLVYYKTVAPNIFCQCKLSVVYVYFASMPFVSKINLIRKKRVETMYFVSPLECTYGNRG